MGGNKECQLSPTPELQWFLFQESLHPTDDDIDASLCCRETHDLKPCFFKGQSLFWSHKNISATINVGWHSIDPNPKPFCIDWRSLLGRDSNIIFISKPFHSFNHSLQLHTLSPLSQLFQMILTILTVAAVVLLWSCCCSSVYIRRGTKLNRARTPPAAALTWYARTSTQYYCARASHTRPEHIHKDY